MKIGYIKEKENCNSVIKRLVTKIEQIFNIVKIEYVNDRMFFILPITNKTDLNKYSTKRLVKSLHSKLYDNYIENIVLSEQLESMSLFKNILYSKNVNILNGKYLFKALSYEILEYIYKQKNNKLDRFGEISIMANDLTEDVMKNIILISKNAKRLNVITNNIIKFQKLDNYLYNELGIIINVSNNRKKSLINSEVIINYDFPSEEIKKYNINIKAIIINTAESTKIDSKRFNGVCINNFKIDMPPNYILEGFVNEIVYESMIYKEDIYKIKKMLVIDEIKIKNLIGTKGIINNKEFAEMS